MKWILLVAAVVALPIVVLFLHESPSWEETRDVWLPVTGVTLVVAVGTNCVFRWILRQPSAKLTAVGILLLVCAVAFGVPASWQPGDLLVRIPVATQGLLCLLYVALLARDAIRRGGFRFQYSLRMLLALMVAVAVCLGVYRWMVIHFLPIPYERMLMTREDVDGVATIKTGCFIIQFNGYSMGRNSGRAELIVAGRSRWPWYEPSTFRLAQDITGTYSDRDQLFTFEHQGHRLSYSHRHRTMIANGQDYSLSTSRLRFVVQPDGQVDVTPLPETAPDSRLETPAKTP